MSEVLPKCTFQWREMEGDSNGSPNDPLPKVHEHATGSYVNRPFPVSEAQEHWARLKSWGLTFRKSFAT